MNKINTIIKSLSRSILAVALCWNLSSQAFAQSASTGDSTSTVSPTYSLTTGATANISQNTQGVTSILNSCLSNAISYHGACSYPVPNVATASNPCIGDGGSLNCNLLTTTPSYNTVLDPCSTTNNCNVTVTQLYNPCTGNINCIPQAVDAGEKDTAICSTFTSVNGCNTIGYLNACLDNPYLPETGGNSVSSAACNADISPTDYPYNQPDFNLADYGTIDYLGGDDYGNPDYYLCSYGPAYSPSGVFIESLRCVDTVYRNAFPN